MRRQVIAGAMAVITLVTVAACQQEDSPQVADTSVTPTPVPPVAAQRPRVFSEHGNERTDEFYWLRDDDRAEPEVLAYLEAENAYLDASMAHTEGLRQAIYEELVGRIKADDSSVPYRSRGYWYARNYLAGKEQPVYVRMKGSETAAPQVLLDENELGANFEYYRIGNFKVTDDDSVLAYAEDTVSRRMYDIRFKNPVTGEMLNAKIEGASTSLAWAKDNRTLFYVRRDPDSLIANEVWRHRVGTPVDQDELVYAEDDPTFSLWLTRSRDGSQIVLFIGSTLSTEVRLLSADDADGTFTPFLPREENHEYSVEIAGDHAYIYTNWEARNFRIMKAPLATGSDKTTWVEVVGHREASLIEDFTLLQEFLVLELVDQANKTLEIVPLNGESAYLVEADETAYAATLSTNPNYDSHMLRYAYTSLTTPEIIFDLDLRTGERTQRKQAYAGDGFNAAAYSTSRTWATARDGVKVPVTLLHLADAKPDGTNPALLLGYGAYGSWYEPEFRSDVLSLVDRGFVFAIAHIRGGQEMGRAWYESGKLLNKKNTFTDFVDVAEHLKSSGWAAPDKVVGTGRSAGGLLIGAVANMAPDAFAALVTAVPFVDVITTMYDESIPLTTFEYDEWGNPVDAEYYQYMLSYSPYDQVSAQAYPDMLVTTGLWDSQVQYWEPAKWVARLRDRKTDQNKLYLYTDMNAGHGGGSGRFERQADRALEYAFILDALGMADPRSGETAGG